MGRKFAVSVQTSQWLNLDSGWTSEMAAEGVVGSCFRSRLLGK